ncbi:unnamed protein product [Caenorhabditis brenneri]
MINQQPPIPRQQSVAEWLFWKHHTGIFRLQVAGTVPLGGHYPTPQQLRYMVDWGRQYYIRNRRELNQQGIFDAHLAPQLPDYQDPRGLQGGVDGQRSENPQPVPTCAQQSGQPDPLGQGFLHQQLGLQEPRARQEFQSPFSIENLMKPGKTAAKEQLPSPMPPQMLPQPPAPPTNFTHMPLWTPQLLTPTPPMMQQTAPVSPQIPLMTPPMLPRAPTPTTNSTNMSFLSPQILTPTFPMLQQMAPVMDHRLMTPRVLPQPPIPPTNSTHMPLWTIQMLPQTAPMLQQTAPVMDHRLMTPQMPPQLPQAPTGRGRGRAPRNTRGVARGGARGRARGGARGRPRKETSTNQISPSPFPHLNQIQPPPNEHHQNEPLVNQETIHINPEIRKALESIPSLPAFIEMLQQVQLQFPPTEPPMVPNEESIPVIDHQEGTSSSFEASEWVEEDVPRDEWPEEENPPDIKYGLEKGYLRYVRVYKKPTNRGSDNDYSNSPDEEEVPPAPMIPPSQPEIGPRFREQVIEPATMKVATAAAVNALSPGGNGALEEDQSASQAVCAKRMGMPVEEQPVTKRPKIVMEGSPPEESRSVSQEVITDAPHDAQQEAEQAANAAGEPGQNGVGLRAEVVAHVEDRQQLRREGLRRLRALMEGRSEEFRRGIVAHLNAAVAILTGPNPPETTREFFEEMRERFQRASNNDN